MGLLIPGQGHNYRPGDGRSRRAQRVLPTGPDSKVLLTIRRSPLTSTNLPTWCSAIRSWKHEPVKLVQVDVRQEGTDDPALRRAAGGIILDSGEKNLIIEGAFEQRFGA